MISISFFSYVSVLVLCVAGRKYDTAADRVQGKLNVHLICHSHDDAGWLKTVDQYYWGANNSIQVAGVQYILDTVVQSLQANKDRRFVFSDMAFFMRWWEQQEEEEREVVSGLVQSGQLDFVGGGYVQHDEAAAHYVAMIDQTTRGHMFLRQTFGKVPRVGWQLDPFGHSSTQAGLLAAHMGFDALFFGRADYQDMAYRKSIKALEMVWRGSDTLGDAEVFTSNFFSGNYGPPNGFDYDWGQWTPPLIDDPRIPDYNVEQRVEDFVARCMEIFNVTRGTDIILPMGSDFHYANAHATYKNLDKLIHYVNKDGRLNLFYSTPSKYVEAKHGYGDSWPLKTDDFFPYADFSHAYWTGYFTSRPTSKGFIRAATSYLQAARQLEAFVGVNKTGWTTDALEEAVALTQHHDSITGTEKQHVANDYHQRLHKGLKEAQAVALAALSRLIGGDNTPPLTSRQATPAHGDHQAGVLYGGGVVGGLPHQDPPEAGAARQLTLEGEGGGVRESSRRLQASQAHPAPDHPPLSDPLDAPVVLHACDWLNVSTCQPSVDLSAGGRGLMVTAYNPLAWGRVAAVRVPVKGGRQWVVHGPEDESIPSQLLSVAPASRCLQALLTRVNATLPSEAGDAEVVFLAELPPTGYNVYFLRPLDALDAEPQSQTLSPPDPSGAHLPVDLHGCPLQQHHAVPAAIQGSSHPPMYYHPPLQQQQQQALQALQAPQRVQRGGGAEHAQQDCGSSGRATLDNGVVALEFDCVTGTLVSMTSGDTHAALTTSFAWYNSSDGLDSSENRGQASGAYIFRPNGRYDVAPEGQRVALELVRGEVVSEARQVFSGWATLVTRLYAGQPWVEVEWTVGPIPHQDGLGREVVLRYGSDVDSGDAFWTDANGREMVKRVRDFRPAWDANVTEPAAGNYYPLTAAMYIQDQSRQLALLTDRAQGKDGRGWGRGGEGAGEPVLQAAHRCFDCSRRAVCGRTPPKF